MGDTAAMAEIDDGDELLEVFTHDVLNHHEVPLLRITLVKLPYPSNLPISYLLKRMFL